MKLFLSLCTLALLLGVPATAQEHEARTALIIGCDYTGTSLQLPSPARDARVLGGLLRRQLGFEVTLLPNPSRKQFLDALDHFSKALSERGGVGLFYFSGHGAQHEGNNYLLPAGAAVGYREDLPTEAVAAERVVTRMEAASNRVNLLFLDACRNNPLPSSKEKAAMAKGLAGMNAANGMLIGFATSRNSVAADSGAGSLYTNALLHHLVTPGLSVTDMLTRVNKEVRAVSGGTQIPFMEVGLSDVFAFVPAGSVAPATPPRPEPGGPIEAVKTGASANPPPPSTPARPRSAADYRGLLVAAQNTKLRVPLTIRFETGLISGTMTQSTRSGDTVVKFMGTWQDQTFHARTGAVVRKPSPVKWESEDFSLSYQSDGTLTYVRTASGETYRADLRP